MTKEETMAVFLNVGRAVFNLKLSCRGNNQHHIYFIYFLDPLNEATSVQAFSI